MHVSSPTNSLLAGVFACVVEAGDAGCVGFCCAPYNVTAHNGSAASTIHFMVRPPVVHERCQLFDRVAGLAILTDLLAVGGFVVVVVTAETAGRIDVADV